MATHDTGHDTGRKAGSDRRFDDHDTSSRDGEAWRRGSGWNESARQVWLAGVGAWTRAQAEGSRVFDGLVRDGLEAERDGTRSRGAEAAGRATEDVRQLASGTLERMGQYVEDSVQRAMLRLGVPRRDDLDAMTRRIDALDAELRAARAAGAAAAASPSPRRRSATAVTKPRAPAKSSSGTRKPPA